MAYQSPTASLIRALVASVGGVTKFSSELGFSRATVHSWLRGASSPTQINKQAIADHFGFDVGAFNTQGYQFALINPETGEEISPLDFEDIAEDFQLLNSIGQNKVREYILDLIATGKYTETL